MLNHFRRVGITLFKVQAPRFRRPLRLGLSATTGSIVPVYKSLHTRKCSDNTHRPKVRSRHNKQVRRLSTGVIPTARYLSSSSSLLPPPPHPPGLNTSHPSSPLISGSSSNRLLFRPLPPLNPVPVRGGSAGGLSSPSIKLGTGLRAYTVGGGAMLRLGNGSGSSR